MVTELLRRLVDHPKRRWIVITLTILVALVATWPAVDEYKAAADRCAELNDSLAETRSLIDNLGRFEQTVSRRVQELSELEAQAMDEEHVQAFRGRVVQLVRDCGCRMRRIRLGEPRNREWYQDDNVHAVRTSTTKTKTPFELRTRQFVVSVAGGMPNITNLLAELSQEAKLMHAARFSIQRADETEEGAVLELEFMLIELARPESASNKA